MGLKPGRIYQEMVEVEDEVGIRGCGGCLPWVIGFILFAIAGTFIFDFMDKHPLFTLISVIIAIVIFIKFKFGRN